MGQERVFGSIVVSANNRLGTPSLGLAGRVLAAARGLAKGPGIHPGPCRHPRPLGSRRLEDISRRGDNRGFDDNRRAETWLAATVGNGTSQPPQWTALLPICNEKRETTRPSRRTRRTRSWRRAGAYDKEQGGGGVRPQLSIREATSADGVLGGVPECEPRATRSTAHSPRATPPSRQRT